MKVNGALRGLHYRKICIGTREIANQVIGKLSLYIRLSSETSRSPVFAIRAEIGFPLMKLTQKFSCTCQCITGLMCVAGLTLLHLFLSTFIYQQGPVTRKCDLCLRQSQGISLNSVIVGMTIILKLRYVFQ
jgi:hypothetical protein